jgi:hypothetical protein
MKTAAKMLVLFFLLYLALLSSIARADGPRPPTLIVNTQDSSTTTHKQAFITELCRRAGVQCALRLLPWSRAVAHTEATDGGLLIGMSRDKSREDRFIWIVAYAEARHLFFKLKNRADIQVTQLTDACKTGKPIPQGDVCQYSVSVLIGSSTAARLSQLGLPAEQFDYTIDRRTAVIRLLGGRSDLVGGSFTSPNEPCLFFPDRCGDFLIALDYAQAPSWWLVANLKTDTLIIDKLKAAAITMDKDGTTKRIAQGG